jgi:hypothetical protein
MRATELAYSVGTGSPRRGLAVAIAVGSRSHKIERTAVILANEGLFLSATITNCRTDLVEHDLSVACPLLLLCLGAPVRSPIGKGD